MCDTDVLARRLVEPGQPALEEIAGVFGTQMLDAEGRLDRTRMACLVFGNPSARRRLEQILHPRIQTAWVEEAERWKGQGREMGFVIIPLLFEVQLESFFDVTICLACSEALQFRRLQARGWDAKHIRQRLDAQWPVSRKIERSDFLIWTGVELEIHAAQLDRVLRSISTVREMRKNKPDRL